MKRLIPSSFRFATILLLVALVCAALGELVQHKGEVNGQEQIVKAEEKLSELQSEMKAALSKMATLHDQEEFHNFFLHSGFEQLGFSFYVSEKNRIIYWSDNEPVISTNEIIESTNGKFLSLPNGDFLAFNLASGDKKFTGLILLRHNYDYQNKYLVNEFNAALSISNAFTAVADKGIVFHLPDGKIAYHLAYDNNYDDQNSLPKWLYLIGLLFAFAAVFLILQLCFKRSFVFGITAIAILLAIRTILIIYKIPDEFYKLPIFSPQLYASSFYFNSLGDLLINAILFLLIAINLHATAGATPRNSLRTFLYVALIVVVGYSFHLLITGLIINSQISFDVNTPLALNEFSIWAFTAMAVLFIAFLFIVAAALKYYNGYRIKTGHAWIVIAICALYASFSLKNLNQFKEQESRKLLAQKLGVRQDHVAEYLFDEARKKMQNDTVIAELIVKHENITAYLTKKYLNGYLARFESTVYAFPSNDSSFSENGFSLGYFMQLSQTGRPTSGNELFFLNSETGRSSYLAFVPLGNPNSSVYTLVIQLRARFLQTQEGFPELFISGNSTENIFPGEYSFARYSGHSLIYEFGNFTYSLTDKGFDQGRDEFSFVQLNDYDHLVYRLNANSTIVVSKANEGLFSLLTLFSWMFGFIGILAFLIYLLLLLISTENKLSWNLTRRIQVSVVFVVVLSFVLVGAGTVIYIDKKYQNDERKSISDQVNALWFMISEDALPLLGTNDQFQLEDLLGKIVGNTNIDFNLFDPEGELLFSSQPKIYDQNIISRRMNPEALFEIKKNQLTQFIHPENAGNLKYISAYAPITDQNGAVKAYLSLPYFEKQNELNKEVSGFLSALLNIYVFLLAIAVLITVIISSRITNPLLLIQEKMSNVRLGSNNERIAYDRNDEIGQLVHEYNRMLEELASSAEKLAKSERETAWREMAKQVAHEIKNPLTPMKLSVQHLQRTLQLQNDTDRDFVNRISGTLIQQIDTLSNIATAFSDFAKMPQANPETVNVNDVLLPIVDLYREIPELDIQIANQIEDASIMIDKDHLNRIFSNILRNALQAIPDTRKGKISIDIKKVANDIQIAISDNGNGIPDDKKDKIFIPNFTTKSSGMGLGLAMVKNLVEQGGGTVHFKSTVDIGTTFYLSFPQLS
jgi:signal transduction histidine kinase